MSHADEPQPGRPATGHARRWDSPPEPAPAARDRPSEVGPVLVVLGLGLTLIGWFALPVQAYQPSVNSVVGFVQLHNLAARTGDVPLSFNPDYMTGLARFWWTFGLLAAATVLVVVAASMTIPEARRAAGVVAAALGIVVGVLHGLSLAQSEDTASALALAVPRGSLFNAAGIGIWCGFVGLAALVIGGLLTALANRARAPRAAR
jgi:hypothetical protein